MTTIESKVKALHLTYTLTAPLSHIGSTASTGSNFQRITTRYGVLPVVTGNSFRGNLRDFGAKQLMDAYGQPVDKEVFNVLFSGGNLNGTMKNDIGKALAAREQFPMVSLFGGALGDMILAGKIYPSFLYPVCSESEWITGIKSDLHCNRLLNVTEYSRMDDVKDDALAPYILNPEAEQKAKASTQMRYGVEYLAPGTVLWQRVLIDASDIEYAAFLSAVVNWLAEKPTLGGMANKGYGFFDLDTDFGVSLKSTTITVSDDVKTALDSYRKFLRDEPRDFNILKSAPEVKKSGKRADKTAEGDGEAD